MRPFLYLSPYFPPDTRVGALRPLKFARHLPALGHRPIVLADAPGSRRDARLEALLPRDVVVIRDYSRTARHRIVTPHLGVIQRPGALQRWYRGSRLREYLERPELVPLGPQALDVPHALSAARRTLAQYDCRAIVVNADPFAAAVVGALLARETGVPLLLDLRDPWALCSLRRPLRKPWVESSVDALERFAVTTASAVILNTASARDDYVAHYRDLPESRFACIPNHADRELAAEDGDAGPSFDRFTLLFAGTLRRFVEGDALLELLVELARRGLTGSELKLAVAGDVPSDFARRAEELGVRDLLEARAPVSYLDVPALLERADLLVVLSHRDRQRIPAKIYDYALSRRPLLVITENPELEDLAGRIGGAAVFEPGASARMADFVLEELARGRQRALDRSFAWSSVEASRKLADLLEAAC